MADFDTLFTEKECSSLLNKCMLRYDPGHFSFKPRLMFVKKLENLQAYAMNFKTEHELLCIISEHFKIGILEDIRFKAHLNTAELESKFPSTAAERCSLIHRNNYYVDLNNLARQTGNTIGSLQALKRSKYYEAITTFMIAATHYNSLVPHLKWLCSSFIDKPYYDVIELKYLTEALNSRKKLDNTNIPAFTDTNTVPEMFCNDAYSYPTTVHKPVPDTLFLQVYHEALVFGVEVIGRIESIPDSDLKNTLYEMFKTSRPECSLVNLLYYTDSFGNTIPTPEVREIIEIKDMEKRYYAIRDFAKKHRKDIDDAVKAKEGFNPMLCEFIKFCQNESIMDIRIKTVFTLYNFIQEQGWKMNIDSDDVKGSVPLPGMLGGVADEEFEEMPESYSMMNTDYADYGDMERSSSSEDKPTKPKPERATIYEELDKLSSKFNSGGYEFKVKDVRSLEDSARTKYMKLSENMSLLNNNLIRSIKEIKVYNTGGKNPGKKTGKIDRKNLYKYKTSKDIFFDNTYKIKESDLAFGILLDVSGSMSGEGIKNGKATMVVLHETLKALNINHCIATHTSSGYHQCTIDRYQAFKEDKTFQCDKNYGIVNIEADWGNCDSGALYYMEHELLRTKNKDKICLIFSDGEPTECSDTELKDQVRHMERNGIKVIGIGINYSKIREYYSNNANGRNLKEMFDIVSNILKEYVLEKVDKE